MPNWEKILNIDIFRVGGCTKYGYRCLDLEDHSKKLVLIKYLLEREGIPDMKYEILPLLPLLRITAAKTTVINYYNKCIEHMLEHPSRVPDISKKIDEILKQNEEIANEDTFIGVAMRIFKYPYVQTYPWFDREWLNQRSSMRWDPESDF